MELAWNDAAKTLTIGARQGTFPGLVKQRTLRIIWTVKDHGVGIEAPEKADTEVIYSGAAVTISASEK